MEKRNENLRNEILNNPNISQELKDDMNNLKNEFEDKWVKEDDLIRKNINAGNIVIGYNNETFQPIFIRNVDSLIKKYEEMVKNKEDLKSFIDTPPDGTPFLEIQSKIKDYNNQCFYNDLMEWVLCLK